MCHTQLPPRRAGAPGRRAQPGPVQDVPHRCRCHPVAQVDELTVDPPMSPSRVLPRQPHHQRADCRPDRWPATGRWSQPRVGPAPGDQLPIPAQQRSWADEPNIPTLPAQQTRQHRQHHPILGLQPRPYDLAAQHRNLMTQMSNSASFDPSLDRGERPVQTDAAQARKSPTTPPGDHPAQRQSTPSRGSRARQGKCPTPRHDDKG
jgi:hypothetical protein